MSKQPFNFPIQLVHLTQEDGTPEPAPALLRVVAARPSQSRRGGYKIALGFVQGDQPVPVVMARLGMN